MPFTNLRFCWNGLVSTDIQKTLAFFPEVAGWSVETVEMGGEEMPMFLNKGSAFAHVRPPQHAEEPAWWNNYLRVEDVDAAVAAIEPRGGQTIVAPNDIPPGRFATVQTPGGALFSLFREANDDDTDLPLEEGGIHWRELYTADVAGDRAMLESLDLPTSEMEMPDGTVYTLINNDGPTRAGALPPPMEGAPSHWLAWIRIADVDAAAGRVTRNGGTLMGDLFDVPGVGRMVVARDPGGIHFGLITPPAS
jgi:predicted enzyme related to lactoylglutathione lyase